MSGFYFDDYITDNSFGDPYPMMAEDMGITKPIQHQLALDYARVMDTVYTEVLARGMFSWQQLWNGQGSPSDKNGCCTGPLVEPPTCAAKLRSLCSADSPAQTRFMIYSFSPGGCRTDPANLTYPLQDIANFLLTRGKYAVIGHGCVGGRARAQWRTQEAQCAPSTPPPLDVHLPTHSPLLPLGGWAARATTRCPSS